MIKYFTKAFKITNENIILTTPLVLFLLLSSIYIEVAQNAPSNIFSAILLIVTILFMVSAFFAGWFFMVKRAIDLDKKEFIIDEDKAKASFDLIKEFPIGVGEFFLSSVGAFILYSLLFILFSIIAYFIGIHFVGKIDLSPAELKMILNSFESKTLISSLSVDKLSKLQVWYTIFAITITIHHFMTMFWGAEVVSGTKNPFIAFFKALYFTLKNIFGVILLFIYTNIVGFVISLIINAIVMIHIIPTIISVLASMLLYFYFIVYVIVLVFLYYDSEKNRQLSKKTQDNSDSGTDSIGQEQTGDNQSEDS